MYTEFIIIYVMLGVALVLLLAAVILLITLLKKVGSRPAAPSVSYGAPAAQPGYAAQPNAGGYMPQSNVGGYAAPSMVYCKRCGSQYSAAQRVCPKCGTPR